MIAVDSSTQPIKQANAVTSLISNSFSPPAGSLLVVVIAGTGNANAVSAITDSLGTHLTYTQKVVETANGCDAEIWTAPCPTAQVGMTVTVSFAASQDISLGVIVLTGAAASQVGNATSATTSAAGAPAGSVTTTAPGSYVLSMIADATNQTAPTMSNGNTDVFNGQTYRTLAASTRSAWAQASGNGGNTGNAITVADSAPTGIAYAMATLEILAASQTWGGSEGASAPAGRATVRSPSQLAGKALIASSPRPTSGQLWPRATK